MIKVENLVKKFGPKTAVDDVSFTVERGEILGFLGPNGAGKSTTMRMVTGFIPPTSGKVTVGGHDIVDSPVAAKKLMGYLPESAPSYPDMTVIGFLKFAAEIRGLSGSDRTKAIDRAVELCFLENVIHQSVDTLSKGFRHRTCFAQSIIHDPDVLIMDEPTDGLDPNQKREIRQLIRRMGEKEPAPVPSAPGWTKSNWCRKPPPWKKRMASPGFAPSRRKRQTMAKFPLQLLKWQRRRIGQSSRFTPKRDDWTRCSGI
jgi:ABC-2 type transport system ATP-binding protein